MNIAIGIFLGASVGCAVVSITAMLVIVKLYTEYVKDMSQNRRAEQRSGAAHSANTAIMPCRLHAAGGSCDVLGGDYRCGSEPCNVAQHNCR